MNSKEQTEQEHYSYQSISKHQPKQHVQSQEAVPAVQKTWVGNLSKKRTAAVRDLCNIDVSKAVDEEQILDSSRKL